MNKIALQIASELKVRSTQVLAAIELLDGGATVPFIARYRKEATDNLDDVQLRALSARLTYLRDLQERRAAVLKSIDEQSLLTPVLREAIEAAPTKQALEDLYLPYKPKRRTKAMVAREAGIEPLAQRLFALPSLTPQQEAVAFINRDAGFADVSAVLDGVRDILAERWAEDAGLVGKLRDWMWSDACLQSVLLEGKDGAHPDVSKFRDYFDYQEPLRSVPSHRALAVLRGRALGWLDVKLMSKDDLGTRTPSLAEGRIAQYLGWSHAGRPGDDLIRKCIAWAWKVKLSLSLERELLARLREEAEQVAIRVFAENLRDLLLAAPAGPRVVMGLDPGIRTGCKVAVIDTTGKVLATETVYPLEPRCDWEGSLATLARLCAIHRVDLVAIGNGTASRETDSLAGDLIARNAQNAPGSRLEKVVVSEAGASVYSASEYASKELPTLDVSLRGAVSIARRLQDPLAELVKIDPKSIGVGQYQHDVNQSALSASLSAVIEDCVNSVGVDVNTASSPLLARVSGVGATVAANIVQWRDERGAFRNRKELLDVSGLGAKTFEQSAGFLRIRGGDNPLDASGVHPETYPLVERLLQVLKRPAAEVIGRGELLAELSLASFVDERFGATTVKDVLTEMEKPGRDPRPVFKVAKFNEGVKDIKDLRPGMTLEGTISNVAQFGAFVNLGVHQDGLIHVSQLAHKFVKDAREVVKTGDIVTVSVLEVDLVRKRISLTMKPGVNPSGAGRRLDAVPPMEGQSHRGSAQRPRTGSGAAREGASSAMADAFARLAGKR